MRVDFKPNSFVMFDNNGDVIFSGDAVNMKLRYKTTKEDWKYFGLIIQEMVNSIKRVMITRSI